MRLMLLLLLAVATDEGTKHSKSAAANHDFQNDLTHDFCSIRSLKYGLRATARGSARLFNLL